jgi:hypothetical protein
VRSYGSRFIDDGEQTMRVAQAHDYSIELPLYVRRVGSGRITCRMLKAPAPAKRIVQLVADYIEAGVHTTRVVQCESEFEEIRQLERLEGIIRAAERRPTA